MADNLITIYERENREEHPPCRSIKTPRKKTNETIRSIRLSPSNHHYNRQMPRNASTIDTQQVHANSSDTATKIPSPQMALPPSTPTKTTDAIIDTAVFAGTTHTAPVQVRDGTTPLSFVPIGGAFTSDADTPQAKPVTPTTG